MCGLPPALGSCLRLVYSSICMVHDPKSSAPPIFELRSASLSVVSLFLKTPDLELLAAEMEERFGDTPEFFSDDPVLVDLTAVAEDPAPIDFSALVALLKPYRIHPVAVTAGSAAQHRAALAAGLPEVQHDAIMGEHSHHHPGEHEVVKEIVKEVVKEVRVEVPVEVVREVPAAPVPTQILDRPLRSGQQFYAKNCDLVVLAMVNFGAEVIADGSIHVYAPLRGKAIAGARGNTQARIFTSALEAELISIAGTYRTAEKDFPPDVKGKPAQVRLEGDKLIMEPLPH
jgi:septum site-determining protein MinC